MGLFAATPLASLPSLRLELVAPPVQRSQEYKAT